MSCHWTTALQLQGRLMPGQLLLSLPGSRRRQQSSGMPPHTNQVHLGLAGPSPAIHTAYAPHWSPASGAAPPGPLAGACHYKDSGKSERSSTHSLEADAHRLSSPIPGRLQRLA